MNMERKRRISVFGSSSAGPGDREYELAIKTGAELARAGAIVTTGGYAGVMEAASRAAREAGGQTVGVTLANLEGRSPNRFLTREIPCPSMYERLNVLIHDSAASVSVGGGIGTLVEVLLAQQQINLGLLEDHAMVLVGPWWPEQIRTLRKACEITDEHLAPLQYADTASEAVEFLRSRGLLLPA